MSELTVKDFVSKDNQVYFDSYRSGIFYYKIFKIGTDDTYLFQIPIEDTAGATFLYMDKSISYMRWIRKSMDNDTFIKKH